MSTEPSDNKSLWRSPAGVALGAFLLVTGTSVWVEQKHVMEALPYLLLLACMGAHFFFHGGHGSHSRDDR